MKFEDFWYVVALSEQLKPNTVLERTVLGEWLAVFRGNDGKPVALRDRCMHRNSRLSKGKVCQGMLQCPYHGWVYDKTGKVVAVPAEGEDFKVTHARRTQHYDTREQDGYVYVRLAQKPSEEFEPFQMPYYGKPGWETVRVINRFRNNVTNCAENFIDIPHTASVHPGVFRTSRKQKLEMMVERRSGSVFAEYRNETTNLGWYTRFLNRKGYEIRHTDSFHMPNVTSVEYDMAPKRRLFITSQSIPEAEDSTLVYTDVTFNYGIWNKIARPFVRWTAQYIIRQDVEALGIQQEVIEKYGTQFANTPADTIHVLVESIRSKIEAGEDPRTLLDKSVQVTFWV
ncbi:aromatic ring-hydroxylating dioxygenase subunit alpha [Trichocoleus sp. ST-U3]|uniref:Rieske 2Fe-2S domain-containing protein n=1 Tax=Coleofasciculus sp. FACHB-542 TaxID=2692787 RepID=UPI001689FD94|nr:aromatic ring-hydroxylating dioxygenase subunit alpha [Coleofasciculus sp. FACHB-542]